MLDTHRPGLEAEADEQKDLGHKDGEGQVGMYVIALVPDSAHRPTKKHSYKLAVCRNVMLETYL